MAKAFDIRVKDRIVALLKSGQPAAGIALEIGCSVPMIYKVGRECGHVFKGLSVMPEHGEEVVALVRAGETFTDVGKRFGCSKNAVADYCHKHGVRSRLEDQNQWGDYDERLRRAVKVIERHVPTFEYFGGFTDTDSPIDLRCKVCGTVKRASMGTVRHGKVVCRVCRAAERERKQMEEAEYKDLLSARERWKRQSGTARQTRMTFCDCGKVIARGKRCADCSRRLENKNHETRRRVKLRKALKDSDISLESLYQRDAGRCWLCGGACDWNDREETSQAIVCGNSYPSIDHVIPLSKGGEHSWENVRLAHRICNSIKSDSNPPASRF